MGLVDQGMVIWAGALRSAVFGLTVSSSTFDSSRVHGCLDWKASRGRIESAQGEHHAHSATAPPVVQGYDIQPAGYPSVRKQIR